MAEISSTGDQMLHILEVVAFSGPITTAELASALTLNRTVAHRLLTTLHGRGYLSRQGKTYCLGPMIPRLASTGELYDILTLVRPVMNELSEKTGETVVLHRVDADQAVVIQQVVNEDQFVRVQHREGSRHPLHAGASGRALLAFQPSNVLKRQLAAVPDPAKLCDALDEVKKTSLSFSIGELQTGAHGIAVPLREAGGVVRYSLAILFPSQRAAKSDAIVRELLAARGTIEGALDAAAE